ncbi:MAG TPA: chemotaxis protein CheB [Humidesulfovibrio sp.]|uniref:chemotaxis protein CheB n=1 Tax=Humidesulfovibrio sp. TaxID=2910988 RepID=UPI002C3870BC|nr:chemotaxis protein CheB [Humidesulfovibrio sp.]HWR02760.1 chemotaxis protein CheB [Humidesulfovibrio sp.]
MPAASKASALGSLGKPARGTSSFPLVGIGASAGGLEALGLFFQHMPAGSNMAFVVVQHLDPTQKGLMVELLQRLTPMPVAQAKERMRVAPGHVYVIPPNKNLSILNGALHLFDPTEPRGLRLPIDFFFRALAADQKGNSVGVILSGMGSDGMLGLRAIRENAGVCFVQDPATAKFDGMPRSAMDAGLADVVASPEELPGRILAFLQHPRLTDRPALALDLKSQSSLEKILILLRSKTGQDFSHYKKSTIYRRIERRMGLHQIDKIAAYARFLQEAPQETELLFKELLIGVTNFFRDESVWARLKQQLTTTLATLPQGSALRAWTPGCSTGEEAYSLAMIFEEVLDEALPLGKHTLQIFATDLDADAIAKARTGLYPLNIATDVSPERLSRFFVQEENGYRVSKQLRESVIFAPQNVIMEPPFTRLDILICRNLLIYLDADLQKRLIPLFHYALKPDGILCLGTSETIGQFADLFAPLDTKTRLYRRLVHTGRSGQVEFPSKHNPLLPGTPQPLTSADAAKPQLPNVQTLADQFLLQRFAPAAVLTNSQGDILYISGRTGKFLEPAAGKANWNVFVMARGDLRLELTSAFHRAVRQDEPVVLKGRNLGAGSGALAVDVTVQRLQEDSALKDLVIVVFSEVPAQTQPGAADGKPLSPKAQSQLEHLKIDLLMTREELQLCREEMQTSQEELKSTNEELQSTNEELQSTNEELTTSKEETQSMNEELQTVNAELQSKLDDLSRSNNDLKNLLNSTDIATLFLDEALNVRRFTPQTAKLIKLIPGDIGRSITDIVNELEYPEMVADAQRVLETLVFVEKPVVSRDGRWFLVRITPYRTLDNRIDGVVITFSDVSTAKRLEVSLRENGRQMQTLLQDMPSPFALLESVFDKDGGLTDAKFVFVNTAFESSTGVRQADVAGATLHTVWPHLGKGALPAMERAVETGAVQRLKMAILPKDKEFRATVYRPDGDRSRICVTLERAAKT